MGQVSAVRRRSAPPAFNVGALTTASAVTSAVTQMAQNLVKSSTSGVTQRYWVISVQVEGFGDSDDDNGYEA